MVDLGPEYDQPDSLREIVRQLTVPARAGVFLTLRDLERVGRAAGVNVAAHSRRMGIEQMFRAAALDDQLDALLDALRAEINSQRHAYRERLPGLPGDWDARAGNTVELLERMSRQVGE